MVETTPTIRTKNSCNIFLATSFIVGIIAVFVGAYRLEDWRYFLVGDEYGFYSAAKRIVHTGFKADPFSAGVHVMNYMAVSFYQALFLALKQSFWMWRFSNIILFLPICVLIYVWGKVWFGPRVGMLAAVFTAMSFFLHNYFLIGYPNPLAVLFVCAMHAAWGYWSCDDLFKPLVSVGLGLLTGLTFYVYLGPIIILSICPYVLYRLWRTRWRLLLLLHLGISLLCAIGLITPGLFNTDALKAMARVTSRSPEFSSTAQIITNIGNCFRMFWWNPRISHFISGPYLDYITQSCLVLGLIAMAWTRNRGSLLLLTAFSLLAALVGATSPYAYPATTRGVVFIPFGCLVAAIGFDWLTARLPRLIRVVSVAALLIVLSITNTQRAESFYSDERIPIDLIFMRDLRKTLANCPVANTVHAHYPDDLSLRNSLANLSFFVSVQTERPITIVQDVNPSVPADTSAGNVCEFYFEPSKTIGSR